MVCKNEFCNCKEVVTSQGSGRKRIHGGLINTAVWNVNGFYRNNVRRVDSASKLPSIDAQVRKITHGNYCQEGRATSTLFFGRESGTMFVGTILGVCWCRRATLGEHKLLKRPAAVQLLLILNSPQSATGVRAIAWEGVPSQLFERKHPVTYFNTTVCLTSLSYNSWMNIFFQIYTAS